MGSRYTWGEAKRRSNLAKHGLDFANADMVLSSRYRLDIPVVRTNEERIQSFSYVLNRLAVLTIVHLDRDSTTRIISFRYASEKESEAYYDWISQEAD